MWRRCFVAIVLVGCSTDTFEGGDASTDGSSDGAPSSEGGGSDAGVLDGFIGPQQIDCPTTPMCDRATKVCCETTQGDASSYACSGSSSCSTTSCNSGTSTVTAPISCDGDDMCAVLGGVCCATLCSNTTARLNNAQCVQKGTCNLDAGMHRFCSAAKANECGCTVPVPLPGSPGFLYCPNSG